MRHIRLTGKLVTMRDRLKIRMQRHVRAHEVVVATNTTNISTNVASTEVLDEKTIAGADAADTPVDVSTETALAPDTSAADSRRGQPRASLVETLR
jgi:hypothetical protein